RRVMRFIGIFCIRWGEVGVSLDSGARREAEAQVCPTGVAVFPVGLVLQWRELRRGRVWNSNQSGHGYPVSVRREKREHCLSSESAKQRGRVAQRPAGAEWMWPV